MRYLLIFLFFPLSVFSQDVHDDDDFEYFFTEEDGITVTGTVQTSQQMAIIEKEEIENTNASDLASLLQEILDLNIARYGTYGNYAGISLRGFDTKRIAFLVNGIPVNSPLDGKFDIEQIDLNSVERIEVIYGGSDSKYNVSGALGGVINIVTTGKQKQGWSIKTSVSNTSAMPGQYLDRRGITQDPSWEDLFDTQKFSFSTAYGKETFSFTANVLANRAQNHFLFDDYTGKTRRKDNNEVWDAGGGASAIWNFKNLTKLIASGNFYYGDKNFPTSGFSENSGNQIDLASRQTLMLDIPRAFHDNLSAEASLAWFYTRRDFSSSAETSRHDQNSLNALNRWNWYAGDKLILRSGIEYSFIKLESTDIGLRDRHDGGLYLTAEVKPVKQFQIIPSLKAVFTNTGSKKISAIPKLGILWNISDSVALKNNYFRSFKFPDFEELYWSGGISGGSAIGNPDLRPEDGWGADIGAVISSRGKKLKNESFFFTQWTKDSIHWYPGSGGIWRPENVAEAMFFGFDEKLSFEVPFSKGPFKKLTASFSYKFLLSYLLSYGYSFESNKRIPYNPMHTAGASLRIFWLKGSFLISGHFESKRYHDTANFTELKPYFLLNAVINQKIGKNFSVFGNFNNILNFSYESFYNYPMPGTTITIGVRFTWSKDESI